MKIKINNFFNLIFVLFFCFCVLLCLNEKNTLVSSLRVKKISFSELIPHSPTSLQVPCNASFSVLKHVPRFSLARKQEEFLSFLLKNRKKVDEKSDDGKLKKVSPKRKNAIELIKSQRNKRGLLFSTSFPHSYSFFNTAYISSSVFPSSCVSASSSCVSASPSCVSALSSSITSLPSAEAYDYDVLIVGSGVGGHAAALQAVSRRMKTAILTGGDVGGTCVNRGCIPSKALLVCSQKFKALSDLKHLNNLGIHLDGKVTYKREEISQHANKLVQNIKSNLEKSLKNIGVDVINEKGVCTSNEHVIRTNKNRLIRAKNVILATGSTPFVPKGINLDGKKIITSDHAVTLPSIPEWICVVGSGYIGLEFTDIFASLGSEVTLVEGMTRLMPSFDEDIAKQAYKSLIRDRKIDSHVGKIASKIEVEGDLVKVELRDSKTKEFCENLLVDMCLIATGRKPYTNDLSIEESLGVELGSNSEIPVDENFKVKRKADGEMPNVLENMFAIGDVNNKIQLAHAASAQAVHVIEYIYNRMMKEKSLNKNEKSDMKIENEKKVYGFDMNSIPAVCFTEPQIAFVGMSEKEANSLNKTDELIIGKVQSYYKSNSKANSENQTDGFVKIIFNKINGKILGSQIIGSKADLLIQEIANAIRFNQTVYDMAFSVRAHPTLTEIVGSAFQSAAGFYSH